ncbi:MAG: hypothetical protein M3493_07200 [Actinomycetota bacterium]|nr:hypothetical protein [Euzebyaceae bacterium]MDQ3452471.1 hypothetical protein [Actinomycetota bacterium]
MELSQRTRGRTDRELGPFGHGLDGAGRTGQQSLIHRERGWGPGRCRRFGVAAFGWSAAHDDQRVQVDGGGTGFVDPTCAGGFRFSFRASEELRCYEEIDMRTVAERVGDLPGPTGLEPMTFRV